MIVLTYFRKSFHKYNKNDNWKKYLSKWIWPLYVLCWENSKFITLDWQFIGYYISLAFFLNFQWPDDFFASNFRTDIECQKKSLVLVLYSICSRCVWVCVCQFSSVMLNNKNCKTRKRMFTCCSCRWLSACASVSVCKNVGSHLYMHIVEGCVQPK